MGETERRRVGACLLALVTSTVAAACAVAQVRAPGDPPIPIEPGAVASAVVAAAPPGSSFVFTPGTHRLVEVMPRDGDRFTAEPGAVLNGALVVDGFVEDGPGRWSAPLPPDVQPQPASGVCQGDLPACGLPEELFVGGVPMRRVLQTGEVGPGSWMLPAGEARVVVGEHPGARVVELSVTPTAIAGAASSVVIEGLNLERYANPANVGVLHMAEGARDWTIRGCSVRRSHGVGIVVRDGASVVGCDLEANGQQGLGGTGEGVLVQGNRIRDNNRAGFDPGWSAGGAKFAVTSGLRVADNEVTGNVGPGLWTDVDCVDTRYEGNVVRGNTTAGIQHEISWAAEIIGNEVTANGSAAPGWVWGAGIQIVNSSDVVVEGNVVTANRHAIVGIDQRRGGGALGEWRLSRLVVRGNDVRDSGQTGIAQDHGDVSVYDRHHLFTANRYRGATSFSWLDAERPWAEWQAFGHDADGVHEAAGPSSEGG